MFRNTVLLLLCAITNMICSGQVNLQTGAAEQSFPLINYTDNKAGLSMGIGMAYSSGNGLMVNEIASDVGTGWSLDGGGVIMRVQVGEPDDQKAFDPGGEPFSWANDLTDVNRVLKKYPNGFLYHNNAGCNEGLSYFPVFKDPAVYKELNTVASDMEQDRFIFRMNGHSGTFVIGKDWKVNTIGDSRLKVSLITQDMIAQGIRTTISEFTITTEDGIKYTFREKGLSQICRYKNAFKDSRSGTWVPLYGNPDNSEYAVNRFWGFELGQEERPYVVNSWFLSEIENTNTKQKIVFSYQNITTNTIAGKTVSHERKSNRMWGSILSRPGVADNFTWNVRSINMLKPRTTVLFYNRSILLTKRLSSISLPNGGIINYKYSLHPREDLSGENALDMISYTLNNQLIRGYKFSYGYFLKNRIVPFKVMNPFEKRFARLCLLQIHKIGNEEDYATEPAYVFSYYTGSTKSSDDIVPAQNYLSQDHWGYYNGSNSDLSLTEDHDFLSDERTQYFKTVLPIYKNPKAGYAKNGLLKSVTFPTGGTIEYYYDQNKPSKDILPKQYTQLAGGVSVIKTVMYDGEDHSKDIITEYAYLTQDGKSSRWGDESPSYWSMNSSDFTQQWGNKKYKYPAVSYPEIATSIDMSKVWGKALLSAGINMGISIGLNAALTGTAAAALIPVMNAFMMVIAIADFISNVTSQPEISSFILSNTNNMLSNPLLPYNSRVEVKTNSPTGYNGKMIYEFTDLKDYVPIVEKLEWPFVQNQRLYSWQYGLPKKVSVFNKDNQLVSESSNTYSTISSKIAPEQNQNCKCATQSKQSIIGNDWAKGDRTNFTWDLVHWMSPRPYYIYSGRADLSSTTEKSFTNGALYYTQTTNILVDPMTLLQKGKIIQKDVNSLIVQLNYYASDYSIPGSALEKLVQLNAIHTPVATETWLLKLNFTAFGFVFTYELLDANITEYKAYSFGNREEIKPWKTYTLKSKTSVPAAQIGMHNRNVLIRKPEFFKLQNEMVYDNDGNLVQTISDDNITSFVNDYSDRYTIASVANAGYAEIAYSSFEANGKGSWDFNTAFIANTSGGITGEKSLLIGSYPAISPTPSTVTKSGLNASKTYIITYWMKDNGSDYVQVNGSAGSLLFQTGSWKLYQHEITGSTGVTISGTATVDELRLYPKGALMSTVTYKEGIGKIADCDANNRLLYYEYDALGRLKLIRDQNRNVIKTYEYNYKKA
jgi:hypothetical protein